MLDQMSRFLAKTLIFMGVGKIFGTHIMENHLGNLSALFFDQAIDQMGQKWPYLAKNVKFWAVLGPKIHFFWGGGVKLLVPTYQETNETPFCVENIGR